MGKKRITELEEAFRPIPPAREAIYSSKRTGPTYLIQKGVKGNELRQGQQFLSKSKSQFKEMKRIKHP